jgi:hypothetical protein
MIISFFSESDERLTTNFRMQYLTKVESSPIKCNSKIMQSISLPTSGELHSSLETSPGQTPNCNGKCPDKVY